MWSLLKELGPQLSTSNCVSTVASISTGKKGSAI